VKRRAKETREPDDGIGWKSRISVTLNQPGGATSPPVRSFFVATLGTSVSIKQDDSTRWNSDCLFCSNRLQFNMKTSTAEMAVGRLGREAVVVSRPAFVRQSYLVPRNRNPTLPLHLASRFRFYSRYVRCFRSWPRCTDAMPDGGEQKRWTRAFSTPSESVRPRYPHTISGFRASYR
jgi:hypothetical protein